MGNTQCYNIGANCEKRNTVYNVNDAVNLGWCFGNNGGNLVFEKGSENIPFLWSHAPTLLIGL